MANNIRDKAIFLDFTVWVEGVGKIGECPSFQPPEITIATEEYRGGGMDGTVDVPHGVEKIEFSFDMHTWDPHIWGQLSYGPGSLRKRIQFRGYTQTYDGTEAGVKITTYSLVRAVRPQGIDAGGKSMTTVDLSASYYRHEIGDQVVNEIDIFARTFFINGVDRSAAARTFLGYSY